MILLPAKIRWAFLAVILVGVGSVAVMELTDWHQLEAVTLDDRPVAEFESKMGLDSGRSVLEQPVAQVAERLLDDKRTVKVDVEYSLPGTMHITTNRFKSVCYLLDKRTGKMLGLNDQGRVVPLEGDCFSWIDPVLTGVKAGSLFEMCDDVRVGLLLPQLRALNDENKDLYRLIDEIDFSSKKYVMVTISGLPYRLKATAEGFRHQIAGFIRFVESYQPEVEGAKLFDLRFPNLIVQTGEKK